MADFAGLQPTLPSDVVHTARPVKIPQTKASSTLGSRNKALDALLPFLPEPFHTWQYPP